MVFCIQFSKNCFSLRAIAGKLVSIRSTLLPEWSWLGDGMAIYEASFKEIRGK